MVPGESGAVPGHHPSFIYLPPLGTGKMLRSCYETTDASVFAYAGILTPRTSTTGAGRSARFVRTARVGGEISGR